MLIRLLGKIALILSVLLSAGWLLTGRSEWLGLLQGLFLVGGGFALFALLVTADWNGAGDVAHRLED